MQIVNLIALFMAELINHSMATGHFQAGFKEAFIEPIVKKADLDASQDNYTDF